MLGKKDTIFYGYLTGGSWPPTAPRNDPPADAVELLLDLCGGQTASTDPPLA